MLLQGAIAAEEKVGLALNAPKKKVDEILELLPSLHSPTVNDQSDSNWVSVEVIVDEKVVRDIIPLLHRAGATGIVEFPLNKVIL